jgi:hypothetical protein
VSKPESSFIAGVHKLLAGACHAEKMHNPYRGGTFDCWYSGTAADLWVEYKFVVLPKRATTLIVPELSPLQLKWGTERQAEGRNVAVIVGSREGGIILPTAATWTDGVTVATFLRDLCTRRQIADFINRCVN